MLRIAANPNAVGSLSPAELCELLAEDTSPAWVFEEAARRTDDRVLACLFSHPNADPSLLERAVGTDTGLLNRLNHHVNVWAGAASLGYAFGSIVPEAPFTFVGEVRVEKLLTTHLPPLCPEYLIGRDVLQRRDELKDEVERPVELDAPRGYAPLARFLLLGDFVHYLTCEPVATPRDLPVTAKVALALNTRQPLEPYTGDADVRVRLAAKERRSWN